MQIFASYILLGKRIDTSCPKVSTDFDLKVSTICLYIGNKTVLFRLKIRKIFLCFQKNGCSEQFKMTVYFIVNSNNQVIIHYINFLGYLFYHQSMKKKPCWFWRFLLYYFHFKIYSLNASKIYYSIKNLCFH